MKFSGEHIAWEHSKLGGKFKIPKYFLSGKKLFKNLSFLPYATSIATNVPH